MSDVEQHAHALRHLVQGAEWNEARLVRVQDRMRATARRRRLLRTVAALPVLSAAVALALWLRPATNDGTTGVAPWTPSAPGVPASSAHDWRALTEDGDFDGAYRALREAEVAPGSLDVDSLFAAADAARLSRHPAEALVYLDTIVAAHPGDPRAALASFTLGRVLLGDLGRPSDAAAAFARARALSPAGTLGQDALAREVEAWHRAGDTTRARERALEYVERHPNGLRLRAVRQYGGLEPSP